MGGRLLHTLICKLHSPFQVTVASFQVSCNSGLDLPSPPNQTNLQPTFVDFLTNVNWQVFSMTYRMTVLTEQPEREAQAPVISFQKFAALNGQFGTIPMNTGMWHSTNHQPSQRGPEGLEGNYESPPSWHQATRSPQLQWVQGCHTRFTSRHHHRILLLGIIRYMLDIRIPLIVRYESTVMYNSRLFQKKVYRHSGADLPALRHPRPPHPLPCRGINRLANHRVGDLSQFHHSNSLHMCLFALFKCCLGFRSPCLISLLP